jgi:hypothetical protein
MGKFHGLLNKANNSDPASKHESPLVAHVPAKVNSSQLLLPSCGKPTRFTEDEDTDKMTIPTAVVSRLTTPTQVPHGDFQQQQPQPPSAPSPVPESNQQQYSKLAHRMIGMVNDLRANGADVALELPTIVVCGQQSARKSSVVEVRAQIGQYHLDASR